MTSTSKTLTGMVAKLLQTKESDDSTLAVPVINDIKALRTMLTMLSLIPGLKTESLPLPPVPTKPQSRELKILNALATILVMEHEVVAVVSKHGDGERVEVIACTDSIVVDKSTKSLHADILENIWNFPVTANPQKDAKQGIVTYPTICDPKDNYYSEGVTLDKLKADVKTYWKHKDFLRHLYVVATCYRKMRRRLADPLSQPYLQFLADIKSSSSFPQFTDTTVSAVPSKNKCMHNDKRFFFKILPKLVPFLRIEIPRLAQRASEANVNGEGPGAVYNKDTYIEYHQLLCELLTLLKFYLDEFDTLKDAYEKHVSFDESVGRVTIIGDALQAMAGGDIIAMHLKIITIGHVKSHRPVVDMDQEGPDEELYQIGSKPPWQAYCEWLKLMVVHFDAVRILITHIHRIKYPNVTGMTIYREVLIKVIIAPHPDTTLLQWNKLLNNERYFDNEIMGSGPSASEIIAFLEEWRDKQKKGRHVNEFIKQLRVFRSEDTIQNLAPKVDDIIKSMNDTMGNYQSIGSEPIVKEIIETMQSFKDKSGPKLVNLDNIIDKLQSLSDGALLFNRLKSLSFPGSLHCELNLVCFMMLKQMSSTPEKYKHIVDELSDAGPVIGVSKPCCPVCTVILSHGSKPFIFRGSHEILSACTLPEWVPESVAANAIKYYKGQLRTALVGLVGSSMVARNRTKSTQSERLSLDSLEENVCTTSHMDYGQYFKRI